MGSNIVIKNVRLSYENLLEARAANAGDDPTFGTAILIPKKLADGSDNPQVDEIKKAISAEVAEGVVKKWGGKRPANIRVPLRDGDAEKPDEAAYAGMWFMNGKGPKAGKNAPVLLNSKGQETRDPEDIYSGVEANLQINFYPYDNSGNKGIACGIASVMSLGTGESLAGQRVTAESAAAAFGIETPAGEAAKALTGEGGAEATEGADATSADDSATEDLWK